jgi:hypothetical protein
MARIERCEIPPHTDRWMMGDRLGDVVGERRLPRSGDQVQVHLDKSGKTLWFNAADCRFFFIEEETR